MPRGGFRKNAGRKKKWNHGETRSIRVPIALADQILELAHQLDEGNLFGSFAIQTQQIIDLRGVKMISLNGQMGVALSELMKKGYLFQPKHLNDIVSKSKI